MAQKSLLITGCSSGIGYDAAKGMAGRGWRVFATCRDPADCARLEADGLESFPLDHTDPDTIRAALAEATSRTGGTLDAIFANGAFGLPGALEDLPTDALRAIFETNFFGVHELVRQTIPVMRTQGHGRIVLNSSVLGFTTIRWRGAYASTKFALEGYGDTLRLEMADANIDTVLIEPGPITSMIRAKSRPHFEAWVDWRASPRRAQYEASLLKRLYDNTTKPDAFELPPAAVTRKLAHAFESPRPRARYLVTTPTYAAAILKRLLPTRLADRILARS
ncbi:SDR family NAD(P)-dependent oxidoreductase [Sinisalibacter lacisalsi]|uniref:Short-chain dehydrogenase/reductase n=1 Tax=Sinisalibacter lacisalsi TaxID=1526570 RepID=A0ABQ1QDK8_9RHOB|nr:SDR family NAD(P)-dependent oxidoreductase [Sinisalibacter lacisalsi]GGD24089.1 short-chain dehydrogenase/reductase [Sinisalibacter lacisalsi]